VPLDPADVRQAVDARLPEAKRLLCELIAIPSLPGQEAPAVELLADAFAPLGDLGRVPLGDWLRSDRDFSDPIDGIEYEGRSNLRIATGGGGGRSLILNSHVDVVPPGTAQERPFDPQERDGRIYGRGACDAKGQLATIWLAMAALEAMGGKLDGQLVAHLVCEEENGGNGTLAMIRRGPDRRADGCIVLEPTQLAVCPSVRGAVWFRLRVVGEPGHAGRLGRTRSALMTAVGVIDILQRYHDRLLDELRRDDLFAKYPDPMPLVIGRFESGAWGPSPAGEATLEGLLGVLPGADCERVMREMTETIAREAELRPGEDFHLRSLYRHEPMVTPVEHPLVAALSAAAGRAEAPGRVEAMTASCDSWLYNNQLATPTVVCGPGDIGLAHGDHEQISLAEIATGARMLVHLAADWTLGR